MPWRTPRPIRFRPDGPAAGEAAPSLAESLIGDKGHMRDAYAARLRARKIDAIHRISAPLMLVNIVNAWVFVLALGQGGGLPPAALPWAVAVTALAAWSLAGNWRKRHRPAPETASPRGIRRIIRSAAIFGILWAVPGALFLPQLDGFPLAFGTALLTGMISGGAFALYPVPAAAMAFLLPVVVSATAGLAATHGLLALWPAIIALMFVFVFQRVIRRNADLFDSEFQARLELQLRNRLIEDLLEDARIEVLGSRRLSEERLAQAKKMEAIGLLTSGIAHDFNNLLTTVRGNAELLSLDGRSEPSLVTAIIEASDRGARQVQRLLSVGQKQNLRPEPVALEALLADLRRILEPSLGPGHPIRTEIAAGTGMPLADPAHLENALINLAFNARDAMPGGGEIRILCGNAQGAPRPQEAGFFVDVSVLDTGGGMDAETRERALDPFFTTKKFGQGSGLGLSSVAGFARQSGGDVLIDSEVGAGSRVTIRLPAAAGARAADGRAGCGSSGPPDPARILVVEDMRDVLAVTQQILEGLGHAVLPVTNAEDALALVESGQRIDLVLTDILLSGSMTGLQLAKEIRKKSAGLPVTFMSAWSPGDVKEMGAAPDLDGRLLRKPFSRDQIAAHVRMALDRSRRQPPRDPAIGAGPRSIG